MLDESGAEHLPDRQWIVYTSADSVFQVAAHEGTVPLEELYAACGAARELLKGEHGVSRVIARPFTGDPAPGDEPPTGRTSACPRRVPPCWTGWRTTISLAWG